MADIVPSTRATNLEPYAPPVPREVAPAGHVNALSLWKAFRARWLRALVVGILLGAAAGAAAYYGNPARYHATALVRVLSSKAGVFDRGPVQETDKSPFQRDQPSLVTSRGVLRSAATSERGNALGASGKYGDLTSWLERNIKVGYLEDTDLMQVSLAGSDAKETAELLNLVVNAYTEEAIRNERSQLSESIETLNNVSIGLQETIRQEKDKLAALAKTLKTADPKALSVQQTLLVAEHGRARTDVAATRAHIREIEVKMATYKALAAAPATLEPSYLIEQQVEIDPLVLKQAALVQDKQDVLLRARNNSLPGNPSLTRFENAVKQAKDQLETARAEARQRVGAIIQGRTRGEAAAEVKQLAEELRIRNQQLRNQLEEEDKLRHDLDRLGTTSFELEAKRADVDEKVATLKTVREKKAQLEVEAQSTRQRVLLMQRAEPPDSKNTRSRDALAALAGIAGLMLGVIGTSLLEVRTRRIQTADDVTGELGMTVVGTLPVLPDRWSAGSASGDGYWGHLVTESVAYIRTVVLASNGAQATRVLMITSAQSQEGKTMLASNLALSIARTGRRTLLLDGDLRRPSIAPLFGVPEGPGISEMLRGSAVPADCIRPSAMPGLSLLPAGRCCRQAIQELAREGIDNVFRGLREEFDFIVVDSSPVLPVSDSLLLGRLVDAVVFCVRPKVSRAPSIYAAHEMLRRVNIPVLGTVINGAHRSAGGGDYLYLLNESNQTPPTDENDRTAPTVAANP